MQAIFYGVWQQLKRTPFMMVILLLQVVICTSTFTKVCGVIQDSSQTLRVSELSFSDAPYVAWQEPEVDASAFPSSAAYNE